MPKENYHASSPYFDTPQTSWYVLPIEPRTIATHSSDQFISELPAKYENRPDLLSYDLYGSPAYWWVFQMRNMNEIRDPIWDMKAGMSIYAPTAERLHQLLG